MIVLVRVRFPQQHLMDNITQVKKQKKQYLLHEGSTKITSVKLN